MQFLSTNLQKSLLPKFLTFVNIAGPIAGFTAALPPLIPFFWNHHLNIDTTLIPRDQTMQFQLKDKKITTDPNFTKYYCNVPTLNQRL